MFADSIVGVGPWNLGGCIEKEHMCTLRNATAFDGR